jgi:hypothetical protein
MGILKYFVDLFKAILVLIIISGGWLLLTIIILVAIWNAFTANYEGRTLCCCMVILMMSKAGKFLFRYYVMVCGLRIAARVVKDEWAEE